MLSFPNPEPPAEPNGPRVPYQLNMPRFTREVEPAAALEQLGAACDHVYRRLLVLREVEGLRATLGECLNPVIARITGLRVSSLREGIAALDQVRPASSDPELPASPRLSRALGRLLRDLRATIEGADESTQQERAARLSHLARESIGEIPPHHYAKLDNATLLRALVIHLSLESTRASWDFDRLALALEDPSPDIRAAVALRIWHIVAERAAVESSEGTSDLLALQPKRIKLAHILKHAARDERNDPSRPVLLDALARLGRPGVEDGADLLLVLARDEAPRERTLTLMLNTLNALSQAEPAAQRESQSFKEVCAQLRSYDHYEHIAGRPALLIEEIQVRAWSNYLRLATPAELLEAKMKLRNIAADSEFRGSSLGRFAAAYLESEGA